MSLFYCVEACDLAKEQKRNFGDDIALQLRAARKKRWNIQEDRRICQEIQLQTYLNKLINEDLENRLAKLKTEDSKNEEDIKKEAVEIEQECVRPISTSQFVPKQKGKVNNINEFHCRRIIWLN